MKELILPEGYKTILGTSETQHAIELVKRTFAERLSLHLNLRRISAPLFVTPESGLNDDLNGVERPVEFDIPAAVKNAVITRADRTREYLRDTVKNIVAAMNETETALTAAFPGLQMHIPSEVHFVSTEELERMYPDKTPREREDIVCREYGCVFLEGIGAPLPISGKPHDGRAPDYDDWSLNGDILIWYEPLGRALELSSMGIRVDPDSLASQLRAAGVWERSKLEFHRMLLAGELPLTIGGGIGQSRLSMAMTDKVHIGEVQCSVWPEDMYKVCGEHGIFLL